jgi:PAS domain S-box-containing protein
VEANAMIQRVLLGDALESATDFGAFVLDEHGRYVAVNDRACELSGYTRDEIVGRTIGEFNPHLAREYAATIEDRRRGGFTFIVRKDGERIELAYRASPTRISAMPFLVVICWPAE